MKFSTLIVWLILFGLVAAETVSVTPKGSFDEVFFQPEPGTRLPLTPGQPNPIDISKVVNPAQAFVVFTRSGYLDYYLPINHPAEFKPDFDGREQRVAVQISVFPSDAELVAGDQILEPPYRLDRAPYFDPATGQLKEVELSVRRPGYADVKLPKRSARQLTFDPVELEPTDTFTHIKVLHRERPGKIIPIEIGVMALILAVPLVGLPYHKRRKAEQKRAEVLDGLNKRVTGDDPNLNQVIGKYRIIEPLGRGGMAMVYKAILDETLDMDKPVAIKLMNMELAEDPDFRARFNREVEVSTSLHHSNIVRMDDWGEDDGRLFLVMELVDGETFRDHTKSKSLEPSEFLELFDQLCRGLKYAHDEGIVHRDLKPANLMINSRKVVKIMDLGLAKGDRPGHDVTKTGDTLGTPAYMAPEQIMGGTLTHRTDQYATGVIAFELLTGRLPFEGSPGDPMGLILQHLNEEPPPLREFKPDLPQALEAAILKMLAKQPHERFADMEEVRQAVTESLK